MINGFCLKEKFLSSWSKIKRVIELIGFTLNKMALD
jgi:hypothetical protein